MTAHGINKAAGYDQNGTSEPVLMARKLKDLNDGRSTGQSVGTLLTTPVITHRVVAGETLESVADTYKRYKPESMDRQAWIETIQLMNSLPAAETLRAGQTLQIPMLVPDADTSTANNRQIADFDPVAAISLSPTQGQTPNRNRPAPITPTAVTTPLTSVTPLPASDSPTGTTATPASPATPVAPFPTVVTLASDSLGTPYVWGGTSLQHGTDCSGLTQGVMREVGVDLPRTSGAQFADRDAQAIPRPKLQEGDLVFFSRHGKIVHVGIYSGVRDGQQVFISATRSKGVAECSIDTWTAKNQQRYAGARRFQPQAAK